MHDRRGAVVRRFSLSVALIATFAILVPPLPAGSDAGEPLTSFHREWVWSTARYVSAEGGLQALDFAGNGTRDILARNHGRWLQVKASDPLVVGWSSLTYAEGLRVLTTADVDGRPEVVAVAASTSGSRVFIHDGATKAILGSFPILGYEIRAAAVGDLNGIGGLEIALCGPDALYVYDYGTGGLLATKVGFDCRDLATGQVDGDPQLEIALAGNLFGGFLLDGLTLEVQWADLVGFGAAARFIDVDLDGLDELVAGRDASASLRLIEPTSGVEVWALKEPFRSLETADVDGDGTSEILAGMWSIRVFAPVSGNLLQEFSTDGLEVAALAAGNVDDDPQAEILASAFYEPSVPHHLLVIDTGAGEIQGRANGLSGPFLAAHVADVDGDGDLELLTASASWGPYGPDPALIEFDLLSREPVWQADPISGDSNSKSLGDLEVGQLDTDAGIEICYSATVYSPTYSRIRCLDGATLEPEWDHIFEVGDVPTTLAIAEVDAESGAEIVVGMEDGSVILLDGETGQVHWRSDVLAPALPIESLRVGVVSASSAIEIVTLTPLGSSSVLSVVDAATGSLTGGPWLVTARAVDLAQMDQDEPLEIVLGDENGDVTLFSILTGEESAPIAEVTGEISALSIADTTRDGALDLNMIADGRLVVRELGGDPPFEWSSDLIEFSAGSSDRLRVGNLDGDPLPELAVATGFGFAMFEGPYEILLEDGFETGDTSAWSATSP